MVIKFQKHFDLEKLSTILVENHTHMYHANTGVIINLLKQDGLKEKNCVNLIVELINAAIRLARFDLAIYLWQQYEPIMVE